MFILSVFFSLFISFIKNWPQRIYLTIVNWAAKMCKIFQSKHLHTDDLWIIIKTKKIYSTVRYFVFILYPFFYSPDIPVFFSRYSLFSNAVSNRKGPKPGRLCTNRLFIFTVRSSHFSTCSGWCKRGHIHIMKPKVSGTFVSWLFESLRQISAWFNDWYLVSHCSDKNSIAFGIFHWFKMAFVSLHILEIPLCLRPKV